MKKILLLSVALLVLGTVSLTAQDKKAEALKKETCCKKGEKDCKSEKSCHEACCKKKSSCCTKGEKDCKSEKSCHEACCKKS